MKERSKQPEPPKEASNKKPYSPPTLKIYGNATKLTAAGTGTSAEGSGGGANDPTKRP